MSHQEHFLLGYMPTVFTSPKSPVISFDCITFSAECSFALILVCHLQLRKGQQQILLNLVSVFLYLYSSPKKNIYKYKQDKKCRFHQNWKSRMQSLIDTVAPTIIWTLANSAIT